MVMNFLERELNKTGDPRDKARGSDIPLPNPESLSTIKEFSPETKEALEKEGYLIYSLTGKSIKDLKKEGMKFWSTWHEKYPDFETKPSIYSEVAFNPKHLFLPNSNNKTLAQQEKFVECFSQKLGQKIKGVKAIIGEAPDYVELTFNHLKRTSERLFGKNYNYDYSRAKTPTVGSNVAVVGYFSAALGLDVDYWFHGESHGDVWIAPLVVPA